jgi:hypothetical protein
MPIFFTICKMIGDFFLSLTSSRNRSLVQGPDVHCGQKEDLQYFLDYSFDFMEAEFLGPPPKSIKSDNNFRLLLCFFTNGTYETSGSSKQVFQM